MIQALSREARIPTLVVQPSTLQLKWYGESNRQVKTLFQVISIIRPCIVVLDELDGLFRERQDDEHEVTRDIKTEFLQWWDGVRNIQVSDDDNGVILVIGATNRPFDVDSAVLRRLPQSYWIGLPTVDDRRDMLWKWSRDHGLLPYLLDESNYSENDISDEDDSEKEADDEEEEEEEDETSSSPAPSASSRPPPSSIVLETMAQATNHYTPSDLWQAMQMACMLGPAARGDKDLRVSDVWHALDYVTPTYLSPQYTQQLHHFASRQLRTPPTIAGVASTTPATTADGWTRLPLSSMHHHGSTFHPRYHEEDFGIWKWQTDQGNFYHLGQVPIDDDCMMELLQVLDYLGSEHDTEFYDELGDYDDDFDDDTEEDEIESDEE